MIIPRFPLDRSVRVSSIVGLAGMALLGAGCPEPVDCTTEAVGSVNVTVSDPGGVAVPDATVTYSADGGDVQDCEAMPDDVWVCGWEVAGEITVTAEAAGYDSATDTVTVALDADGCHVVPQAMTLTLTPLVD